MNITTRRNPPAFTPFSVTIEFDEGGTATEAYMALMWAYRETCERDRAQVFLQLARAVKEGYDHA